MVRTIPRILFLSVVLAGATATTFAAADVARPEQTSCNGKDAGASCEPSTGVTGTCAAKTCTRTAAPVGDAGPTTQEYACLVCVTGGSSGSSGSSGSDDGGAGTTTSSTDKDDGGCSVGGGASAAAPWALAIAAAAAVSALGRRKRK